MIISTMAAEEVLLPLDVLTADASQGQSSLSGAHELATISADTAADSSTPAGELGSTGARLGMRPRRVFSVLR